MFAYPSADCSPSRPDGGKSAQIKMPKARYLYISAPKAPMVNKDKYAPANVSTFPRQCAKRPVKFPMPPTTAAVKAFNPEKSL